MRELFEIFFKYPPLLYERGSLALARPLPWWLWVGALLLAGAAVAAYLLRRPRLPLARVVPLALLRVALVAILAALLARPVLRVPTVVPRENQLAVLVDDSRSMAVRDVDGGSRGAFARAAFGPGSELAGALDERFRVRHLRFASGPSRLTDWAGLGFDGERTRIGAALRAAAEDLGAAPASGVVLVTDGADNGSGPPDDALVALRAAGLPVFAVGLGSPELDPDIAVARINAPRSVLRGGSFEVAVELEQRGFAGQEVTVVVEADGRIVGERALTLPADGETEVARVRVDADVAGIQRLRARVEPRDGELVDGNNAGVVDVEVRGGVEKILYVEGEPRFEAKFLRRAVEDDEEIQLVVLQRTAEGKYLRLAVDSAPELASGFPTSRAELFEYRAVVLGSLEASFLSQPQQELLEAFVAERGGGLLALGGHDALAEGGWAGTSVGSALPVELDQRLAGTEHALEHVLVRPSIGAREHPVARVGTTSAEDRIPWDSLPPLTVVNRLGALKPGARAVLRGQRAGEEGSRPLFAEHRFGRGRVAVFAVQDSWLWQMHAAVPVEDDTHEAFWRQTLRWLVSEAPDNVDIRLPAAGAATGDTVEVRLSLADAGFEPINRAEVRATALSPSGVATEIPLTWTLERDGDYRGAFVAGEPGRWEVRLETPDSPSGTSETRSAFVTVEASRAEDYGSAADLEALRALARETGGGFYDPSTLDRLVEDIAYAARGVTLVEEKSLWDLPFVLLSLLVLVAAEWTLRRRWRLA
jgi:uncharacterized membrane protein